MLLIVIYQAKQIEFVSKVPVEFGVQSDYSRVDARGHIPSYQGKMKLLSV